MLETVGAVANNTASDKLHDEDVKVNRLMKKPGTIHEMARKSRKGFLVRVFRVFSWIVLYFTRRPLSILSGCEGGKRDEH